MDLDAAYRHAQSVFVAGAVSIVGSGASAAYGLPSMHDLAAHLLSEIAAEQLDEESRLRWASIRGKLEDSAGLESALGTDELPAMLAAKLTEEIAACVGSKEVQAIDALVDGPRPTTYGRLLKQMLKPTTTAVVVTTNYDRLIEVAAGLDNIRVDSMFYGDTIGRLDEQLSRGELLKAVLQRRSNPVRLVTHPHVQLSKPHGSLDWVVLDGEVVRSDVLARSLRSIVPPGGAKYRVGYHAPYDQQRNRANRAIDAATAFLTVGYGFNDEHLQTHLVNRFSAVPSVVMARTLTENASQYVSGSERCLGIQRSLTGGAKLTLGGESLEIDKPIWQLDAFLTEVLGE